jgi:hypothetical protein
MTQPIKRKSTSLQSSSVVKHSEEMHMRVLLLSALFAFGFGFAGTGSGMINGAGTNFSPRVQQATHQCRATTVCDDNGKNCHTADKCH